MEVRHLGFGVREVVPRCHGDSRGFFAETWQRKRFAEAGMDVDWVQENQSLSAERHVLRGLHLQIAPMQQTKLLRVLRGSVFDVAVDIRPQSESFGKWVSCVLSAEAFNQLFIPAGFAHGFLTLEPGVEVSYKVSAPFAPDCERRIAWNDPQLAIEWPLAPGERPVLSEMDAAAATLATLADSGEL